MNPTTKISRSAVLFIAWPIILSNLSTPLLGLVDTAVIGNLGDPALIGAIAVGAMIFSFIFWGFGFLRMGTTGLVAQANGAGDVDEVKATFYRATILAAMIAFMLLLLQKPLAIIAFSLIEGSDAVESAALTYFTIRIWGAPFSLLHLAVLGYLLGQGKSTLILWLQLLLNGTNIVLDVVFVVFLGWDVAGIAAATLIAEILAATFGLFLVLRHMRTAYGSSGVRWEQLKDIPALVRMLNVNRDIMIRTLCLIFAFAWFTNEGAKAGDVLLASNAILMQFVSFSAFFLDGYALAAESLVGVAVGARNEEQYSLTLRYICELGFANSLLLSGAFFFGGPFVIDLLTNVPEVREASRVYLVWAIAAPVVSLWCYLLDGVFIGATCTKEMRNAMIISLLAFLAGWYLLQGPFGNHGLWLSLQLYFIARALSLAWYLPNVRTQTMS
ncbi:MAG: MATE family efflux transporter [Pseudomonadales bacterium]|nr:MATE family efflux transporter [Pseudomonadales bacterium]